MPTEALLHRKLDLQERPQLPSFQQSLAAFRDKYVGWWMGPGHSGYGSGTSYTRMQQRENERSTDELLESLERRFQEVPDGRKERASWRKGIRDSMCGFAVTSLRLPRQELDILLERGYIEVTQEFLRQARSFQSEMEVADAFQALRNVWIANSIQMFLNRAVVLSPSIFGYSMLYPLTDNFLDSRAVSRESKSELSRRLRERLAGRQIEPVSLREQPVFDLVGLIEKEYSRPAFPEVYWSLLAIQEAQTKSLLQQHGRRRLTESEILEISIEKGGASVLADGYLAAGKLSDREAEFFFGYGVLLQFLDDLQDVSTDLESARQTLFTDTAAVGQPLDGITSRLGEFLGRLLGAKAPYPDAEHSELKGLILRSCRGLLLQAVGLNRRYFGERFVRAAERFSPVSFDFLQNRRESFEGKPARLARKLQVLKDLDPVLHALS